MTHKILLSLGLLLFLNLLLQPQMGRADETAVVDCRAESDVKEKPDMEYQQDPQTKEWIWVEKAGNGA